MKELAASKMGSDANRPVVSVVIPLYNKAPYIERAIRSVLKQSNPAFELIVVDDGSSDGGDRIVEEMTDPRLRLVRRPSNGGQGAARNTGIHESRGEIIAFLDGDDEWDPEHLEAIISMGLRFPEAGLFATGYRTIFPRHLIMEMTIPEETQGESQYLLHNYFERARAGPFVWISALAVRRSVFEEVGAFLEGEHIGGDVEMSGRVALKYPIAYDRRILATYHAEAHGRENPRRDRKLQAPPFARTYREAQLKGKIRQPVLNDVQEYVHSLWLSHAGQVISHHDRTGLKRILKQELSQTREFRGDARLLALLASTLPMRAVSVFWRLRLSRYWPGFSQRKFKTGIIYRKLNGTF